MPEYTLKGQEPQRPHFIVGSDRGLEHWLDFCPSAKTLTAWSETEHSTIFCQIRCRRWACPHCGQRNMTRLSIRCADAKPNKLLTLTVNPRLWSSPRDAFDSTRRKVSPFAQKCRKNFGEFEYLRILEITKKGWPHYHLVLRSPFIPQQNLSDWWNELTGAPIVDVRKIYNQSHAYRYVLKYLGKQKYIPWTNRRVTWSRRFFPPQKQPFDHGLTLMGIEVIDAHPVDYLEQRQLHGTIERITTDCFRFRRPHGRQDDD